MEDKKSILKLEKRTFLILIELHRYRRSLVNVYRAIRKNNHKLRELEKKVSSFVEPS